jgi:hypothetical protein
MNENQLYKISKILKVRINKNEQENNAALLAEEMDEGPSASVYGDTEQDELLDKVEELQVALAQDQGLQEDT